VLTISLFAFTKQMVRISGGPSSGGNISSSNASIRRMIFSMSSRSGALLVELRSHDSQFRMPVGVCQQ
jgi:hypothetical protein